MDQVKSHQSQPPLHKVGTATSPTLPAYLSVKTPVFTYGTLMAAELLAWVLTGDAKNAYRVREKYIPATLQGYKRVPVRGGDYPALIHTRNASDTVQGYLVYPESEDEWRKLDNFEGEVYERVEVEVEVLNSSHGGDQSNSQAFAYVWVGGMDGLVVDQDWDFDFFRNNRLEDWLDLFDGVELV